MKLKYLIVLILFVVALLPLLVVGQASSLSETNSIPSTNTVAIPETFKPLIELLKGNGGTHLTQIIIWVMTISAVLAPFAVWIRNKLADALNNAAASETADDDVYLRRLFSNVGYRFIAFLLNFANIRLPTLAELERALELQHQAVLQSRKAKINPSHL